MLADRILAPFAGPVAGEVLEEADRRQFLLGPLVARGAVGAQQRAVRFEITAVSDTTLLFRAGTARWVHAGQTGTAVDPRRRDALVARFRVLTVRDGLATALVTGQTTSVMASAGSDGRLPPATSRAPSALADSMKPMMRSYCTFEMIAPMVVAGSVGMPGR